MSLLAWVSLLFFAVALVGSAAYATVHGLRTWRAARALSGAVGPGLDGISRGAEHAEAHATRLSDGSVQLSLAAERLQRSLAQLDVLRDAATRARATLDPRHAFPRK